MLEFKVIENLKPKRKENYVVVKVQAFGLNHNEALFRKYEVDNEMFKKQVVPRIEYAGAIEESLTDDLKKGDTVIALMGGMGRSFNGSYEEYALLPIKNVFKIDTFSKLVDITDEQKKDLLEKYSKLPDAEIIKDLSESVYRIIGPDSPFYDYDLTTIRNYNTSICPPVEKMKTILTKMFSNEVEENMSLEENHRLVNESLTKFTTLFNQYGIDYYIVGALPCFLKTGQQLFRYHDDIDIMVKDDISKIAKIVELSGYKFQDDRFPNLERFQEIQIIILVILNIIIKLKMSFLFCYSYAS